MVNKTRILAVDFGLKRVGLAVSDQYNKIALPLDLIENNGYKELLVHLKTICNDYDIGLIVLGHPVGFEKEKTNILKRVDDFAELMKKSLEIPVEFEDERYSTIQARKYMLEADVRKSRKKTLKDSISATIFLQSYLDIHSDKK